MGGDVTRRCRSLVAALAVDVAAAAVAIGTAAGFPQIDHALNTTNSSSNRKYATRANIT